MAFRTASATRGSDSAPGGSTPARSGSNVSSSVTAASCFSLPLAEMILSTAVTTATITGTSLIAVANISPSFRPCS
jgi:hypothetical protein